MMRFIYVFFQGALEQKGVRQAEFNNIGGASHWAILVLFKSATKNMACSGKKSDAI